MIHINIGSNLNSFFGTKFDNILKAVDLLIESKIKIKKISNFYETPSYPNQRYPKFINVGLNGDFEGDYMKLFKVIKLIEKKLGRKRSQKNSPRTIDIDIIDFNSLIKKTNKLILPHPKSHLRNFVLYPIFEIDTEWSHPIFKKNAEFLINKLSQKSRIEITRLRKSVII